MFFHYKCVFVIILIELSMPITTCNYWSIRIPFPSYLGMDAVTITQYGITVYMYIWIGILHFKFSLATMDVSLNTQLFMK